MNFELSSKALGQLAGDKTDILVVLVPDGFKPDRGGLSELIGDALKSEALETKAKEVPLKQVQAEMDGGYGIYAGDKRQWAKLAFEPQAAQWVSREEWHPEQQSKWLEGGVYELTIPYTEETEILMDILRHGDQVRVLAPESLVEAVRSRLLSAVSRY